MKLQGDFIRHDHQNTDETIIVIEGDLRIDFRNGAVHIRAGEMFVVPKGVEHKPYAENEVKVAPDRAARRAQYRGCGRRADSGAGCLDLNASRPPTMPLTPAEYYLNKKATGGRKNTRSGIILRRSHLTSKAVR